MEHANLCRHRGGAEGNSERVTLVDDWHSSDCPANRIQCNIRFGTMFHTLQICRSGVEKDLSELP